MTTETPKRGPTWLRDLLVTEISLVDRPANPGARIVLAKRDDTPLTKERFTPMNRSQLTALAKCAIDGIKIATRETLADGARRIAKAEQRADESFFDALGRFYSSDAGRVVRQAMDIAPAREISDAAPRPGPAMAKLHQLADHVRSGTGLSRASAVAKIASMPEHREVWNAAKNERAHAI